MRTFGKIGRRLLWWFLVVTLVPLLLMGFLGYRSAKRAVEREVFLHMEAVAKSKQHAITQWFRERKADLRALAGAPMALNSDSLALEKLLNGHVGESGDYSAFHLLNEHDQVVLSTNHLPPSDLPYDLLRRAREVRVPVMSPIYLHRNLGPAMDIAASVQGDSDSAQSVLIATLRLEQSLDPVILDTSGLGKTGQAYLVDTAKVMLTPSRFMHHPHPLTHTMDSEGIRLALKGTTGASVYEGFEGQPVIGAWTYLPEQQWALIAEMDAAEAFAPLARLRRNTILVSLLTMAAIAVVVFFVSRSISRPIRELADASLDISRGNLDRAVAIRLKDEVGELAERFNAMMQSLRESQRQLVQSARLAAIGELVASVVHEMRNPLSAVKMNLRILDSRFGSDPATREHFDLARSQVERMEKMLAELLDYSKPAALQLRDVSLGALIAHTLREFEGLRTGEVEVIENVLRPDTVLYIDADGIRQVLLNLLLNAQQSLPAAGTITVSAETIQSDRQNAVRIVVRDTGAGISEENLKHVFDPFFTTRKQGTGLGLSNARKVVEAHGGTLTLRSALHLGTEAEIILPLKS